MVEQERGAIQALKVGDIGGLETLVKLHQLQAMRAAYGITADRSAAEDVVADAFLSVFEHIGQYEENRPFAPWLYRIVVNGALKWLRGGKHIAPVPRDDTDDALDRTEWLLRQSDRSSGPELEAEQRELRQQVTAGILKLPPAQRAVVVLRYYLDMDEATIAETLGCPQGTVKWRLHAAKRKLRHTLATQREYIAPGYGAED